MTPTAPVTLAFDTAGVISLLLGFVFPNLVGLITKESMNKGVKAALLAATSGVSGVLSQWLNALLNHTHFAWQASVLTAVATWLVSEGSYLRIWKPSGVSDFVQRKLGFTDSATDDENYVSRHAASAAKVDEPLPVASHDDSSTVSSTEPTTPPSQRHPSPH